jgi:serine/threonine protein kinase
LSKCSADSATFHRTFRTDVGGVIKRIDARLLGCDKLEGDPNGALPLDQTVVTSTANDVASWRRVFGFMLRSIDRSVNLSDGLASPAALDRSTPPLATELDAPARQILRALYAPNRTIPRGSVSPSVDGHSAEAADRLVRSPEGKRLISATEKSIDTWNDLNFANLKFVESGTTCLVLQTTVGKGESFDDVVVKLHHFLFSDFGLLAAATQGYSALSRSYRPEGEARENRVVESRASSTSWIVLDYVAGDTLRAHLQRLYDIQPPDEWTWARRLENVLNVYLPIVDALTDCRDGDTYLPHGDLNPSNIMYDSKPKAWEPATNVRFIDVGRNLLASDQIGRVRSPDRGFVAPEVLRQAVTSQAQAEGVGPYADLYSLGVLLLECLGFPQLDAHRVTIPEALYGGCPTLALLVEDLLIADPPGGAEPSMARLRGLAFLNLRGTDPEDPEGPPQLSLPSTLERLRLLVDLLRGNGKVESSTPPLWSSLGAWAVHVGRRLSNRPAPERPHRGVIVILLELEMTAGRANLRSILPSEWARVAARATTIREEVPDVLPTGRVLKHLARFRMLNRAAFLLSLAVSLWAFIVEMGLTSMKSTGAAGNVVALGWLGHPGPYQGSLASRWDQALFETQTLTQAHIAGATVAWACWLYYDRIFGRISFSGLPTGTRGWRSLVARVGDAWVLVGPFLPVTMILAGNTAFPSLWCWFIGIGFLGIGANNTLMYLRQSYLERWLVDHGQRERPLPSKILSGWRFLLIVGAGVCAIALCLSYGWVQDRWAYLAVVLGVNIFLGVAVIRMGEAIAASLSRTEIGSRRLAFRSSQRLPPRDGAAGRSIGG